MSLFKKKCGYCREKIDKGKEIFKEVKVLGFIGTGKKAFCCEEHVKSYEKKIEEYMNKPKNSGCCG